MCRTAPRGPVGDSLLSGRQSCAYRSRPAGRMRVSCASLPCTCSSPRSRLSACTLDANGAASGFVLWLQLALRETSARLCTLAQVLGDGAEAATAIAMEADWAGGSELPAEDTTLPEVKAILKETLAKLQTPEVLPPETWLRMLPRARSVDAPSGGAERWLRTFRSRLYLLDEPEQRLHPALQRRAARWLATVMGQWRSQCLLATHAVAFMDIAGDIRVYELTRVREQAYVAALDVASLTPQAQLAREMGLDRGEPLPRWRAFLFVQDNDTVAVLDQLFAERLASAHIRVLAIDDHRERSGLFGLDLLPQFTAVPIAVLFTSVANDDLAQLQASSSARRARLADESLALFVAAKIADLARRQERDIEILTLDVPEIIDVLDENTIRQMR
ncbi:MAG: AAA family ATPase [Solirubrobacteraceae bacterium]